MKRIAVFASGGGTDFQSVIDANERRHFCEIALLVASKHGIGAIERAQRHGIRAEVFAKADWPDLEALYSSLAELLESLKVDYIVLAGWLKIIPESFIKRYEDRIINKYGAKISGCTVHFVNEVPDGGAIIAQRAVEVAEDDTPESLQARILAEEHKLLPYCVEKLCEGKIIKCGRKVAVLD